MSGSISTAEKNSYPETRPGLKIEFKKKPEPPKKPIPGLFVALLVLGIGTLWGYHIYLSEKKSPLHVVIDEEGNEALSPERNAKLKKELDELDNAEQYALIADLNGYYPCFTCPDGSTTIYLYKGEVWKYGTTRKGEQKRYPGKSYGAPNLSFIVQFQGNYVECLKLEKIKIYNYPLLPEAKKRTIRLFRPPGNLNDN